MRKTTKPAKPATTDDAADGAVIVSDYNCGGHRRRRRPTIKCLCVNCGRFFMAGTSSARYCSAKCYNAARYGYTVHDNPGYSTTRPREIQHRRAAVLARMSKITDGIRGRVG